MLKNKTQYKKNRYIRSVKKYTISYVLQIYLYPGNPFCRTINNSSNRNERIVSSAVVKNNEETISHKIVYNYCGTRSKDIYDIKQSRRETFLYWPHHGEANIDELVEAGFYYTGK